MNQNNTAAYFNAAEGHFYKAAESAALIPFADCASINHWYGVFRNTYLALSAVQEQVRRSGYTPAFITIYTDVLLIQPGINWLLSTSRLLIVARRIEVSDQAAIVLNYSQHNNARLVIFAAEFEGALAVTVIEQQRPAAQWTVTLNDLKPGIDFTHSEGTIVPRSTSYTAIAALLLPGDLQLYLTHQYLLACLCCQSKPVLSVAIFRWIHSWAAGNDQLTELHNRCTALLVPGFTNILIQTGWSYTPAAAGQVDSGAAHYQPYQYLLTCSSLTAADIALVHAMGADTAPAAIQQRETEQDTADALALVRVCMQQNQQQFTLLVQQLLPGDAPLLALQQRLCIYWLDTALLR